MFLWHELADRSALIFVFTALACFVAAVGLDSSRDSMKTIRGTCTRGSPPEPTSPDFARARFRHTPYDTLEHFSRSLEEFLEMLANTLLW